MATLSGQTIQSTYPGLLKLSNSTSGVTVAAQAIEDGYGNDTGVKLGTDYLTAPNILNINDLKNDYYGTGFAGSGTAPVANSQNVINATPFYDNGMYDYSAITYNVASATTIGDTFECAFYTAQQIDGLGIGPFEPIMSGITLTVNSTGVKTDALPSNLSFSAHGPGVYWFVYKITNSGATPTFRLFATQQTGTIYTNSKLGFTLNAAGTATSVLSRAVSSFGSLTFSGLSSFPSAFTQSDLAAISSTVNTPTYGFALKVTRP